MVTIGDMVKIRKLCENISYIHLSYIEEAMSHVTNDLERFTYKMYFEANIPEQLYIIDKLTDDIIINNIIHELFIIMNKIKYNIEQNKYDYIEICLLVNGEKNINYIFIIN